MNKKEIVCEEENKKNGKEKFQKLRKKTGKNWKNSVMGKEV